MAAISEKQLDILLELVNMGVGKAAGLFNKIIDAHLELSVPSIKVVTPTEFLVENSRYDTCSLVRMPFKGPVTGIASLVFPPDSARILVSVLTGEDIETIDLDSVQGSTLVEIGNIVLNGVMGTLANLLDQHIVYAVPDYVEDSLKGYIDRISDSKKNVVLIVTT
ncbi:MAG: chemotaxis protein CheC, partial [Candidatus Odinarchaeota archaeon]